MAIVEETIGSGKTRATVTLWEANVGAYGTDIYQGTIQTDDEFNEDVVLSGSTGTPSITSYLWLRTDPANRHAGVAGTGHGRMRSSGTAHTIEISNNADFCRVEGLEIQQDSATASAEGIRLDATTNDILIQDCIIWSDQNVTEQDGVYTTEGDAVFDNVIVYGFHRAAFHIQVISGSQNVDWQLDHCAWYDNGHSGSGGAGGLAVRHGSAATGAITVTLYNCWGAVNEGDVSSVEEPMHDQEGSAGRGTPTDVTWSGTHNLSDFATQDDIDGTDNTTNWQAATDGIADVTKSTGSWIVVVESLVTAPNLLLLDDAAGNLAAGNGTNRQGSEPDTRQDFSTDITGGARPTSSVDIGPHQVSVAAAGDPLPPRRLVPVYHRPSQPESQVFG